VFTYVAFTALLFDDCSCNLCVLWTQALLLSNVAERIIAEEGSATLQKHVAELEKENLQLKVSKADMQKTVDNSNEAVTVLPWALEEEIESYDLLKNGNDSLLEECNNARYQVVDLESELEKVKASGEGDISTSKVRLAAAEARVVDDLAAVEKSLVDFRTELTEDLAGLCEVYECNIQCLNGICSPIPDGTPSAKDYVRWLTSEVGCLLWSPTQKVCICS
jgi:hypothetical protein